MPNKLLAVLFVTQCKPLREFEVSKDLLYALPMPFTGFVAVLAELMDHKRQIYPCPSYEPVELSNGSLISRRLRERYVLSSHWPEVFITIRRRLYRSAFVVLEFS